MSGRFSSMAALAAALFVLPISAGAEEEHRELGPHEHGHGALNIVIEGNKIAMELHSPGMDLVGFEHEPTTPEQKAETEKAKADLETNPLGLIVLPADAGCKLTSAKVEILAEGEHEDDHAAENKSAAAAPAAEEEEAHHNEFRAAYALECADASKVTSIDFPFFERFNGAQELEVTIIDGAGQAAFEVERGKPQLVR